MLASDNTYFEELNKKLKQELNDACVEIYRDREFRNHLGASDIGHPCNRYLYLTFHWARLAVHDGRTYRLYDRGKREENHFTRWLIAAGWEVLDTNPETGQQWRVSGVNGHFGGSCDAILRHKDYFEGRWILGEYKTHGNGSFAQLVKHGAVKSKPKHYIQICVYGQKLNLDIALYFPIGKNDDDIQPEFIQLDHNVGIAAERKAEDIITADEIPVKISEDPAFFECKSCVFNGICHKNHLIAKNCRSCKNSKPVENGEWYCEVYKQNIPKHFLQKGCEDHYNRIET